jgi:hypothetical protein
MYQTIQLDWSSGKGRGRAQMEVDWATRYAL